MRNLLTSLAITLAIVLGGAAAVTGYRLATGDIVTAGFGWGWLSTAWDVAKQFVPLAATVFGGKFVLDAKDHRRGQRIVDIAKSSLEFFLINAGKSKGALSDAHQIISTVADAILDSGVTRSRTIAMREASHAFSVSRQTEDLQ